LYDTFLRFLDDTDGTDTKGDGEEGGACSKERFVGEGEEEEEERGEEEMEEEVETGLG